MIDDDGRPSSRLSMIIERQSFESGAKRKTKQKESVSEMFGNGETREEEEGEKKKKRNAISSYCLGGTDTLRRNVFIHLNPSCGTSKKLMWKR